MMNVDLQHLIQTLTAQARRDLERAAERCVTRGGREVLVEDLLLALLEHHDSLLVRALADAGVEAGELQAVLQPKGEASASRNPVFSPALVQWLQQAVMVAHLELKHTEVDHGALLLALLRHPSHHAGSGYQGLLSRLNAQRVQDFLLSQAGENTPAPSGESLLGRFTHDLTRQAHEGRIDPVLCRDAEIRQLIDILVRRRKNNPILVGEAGVGKTAVVEGLALRVASAQVPQALKDVRVLTLDMGLLQAGASIKGEFERRLKGVIDEVNASPKPVILFIDEAHTLVGAGAQAGASDAANLLKPALARGELRTIAATTWSEYKKYFEKDAALARRFQVVKVEEPTEALAAAMLRGMVGLMEAHFNIRVMDEAVTEAVRLSHRYISGRQLPDKAVSVLDTACAKVALGQSATPAIIEDTRKHLDRLDAELAALQRETAGGANHHAERLAELQQLQADARAVLATNEERLSLERALADQIRQLRQQMENGGAEAAGSEAAPADVGAAGKPAARGKKAAAAAVSPQQAELDRLLAELRQLQGDTPMVPLQVDGGVVAEIVSAWTGVPLGRMVKDEIRTVRTLGTLLVDRVIGQDHALEAIAQRVRTATAKLEDPNKPRGVFMFVGPSGVGKTETALALADILYGGERKLITINMSEYQEAHSVSGLKGSPPGYVGYGEGGVLTEAVRRNPYSVVLLDEVEKAHPDVLEMFFQVFDKGQMDDAEGREIDFRNTLIILTSNIGSSQIMQACLNKPAEEIPTAEALGEALRPVLMKSFKPAFLGRMKVVPYFPINDDVLAQIIALKLGRIRDRVAGNHKATFLWDDSLVEAVLSRCTEVDSGARNVDHILNGTLLPEVAESVLAAMAEGNRINTIKVTAGKNGAFKYKLS